MRRETASLLSSFQSLAGAGLVLAAALTLGACAATGTLSEYSREPQPRPRPVLQYRQLATPGEPAPAPSPAPFPAPAPGVLSVAAPGEIRVAMLLPLSGEFGELGGALMRAGELALFDAADDKFVLVPIDTKGTPEGARAAMEQALDERVTLVLGPLLSGSAAAIKQRAAAAGVTVISFSTDPAVAGEGVFVMGFLARQQVERLVEFAVGQGLYRFAVLAPANAYGESIAEELREVARRNYALVTRVAFYDPAEADVTAVTRKFAQYDERRKTLAEVRKDLEELGDEQSLAELESLKKADTYGDVDFDAVLLPEGGDRLRMVSSLLSFYDVDPDVVRYLGTGQWDDPMVRGEPALRGGWFPAPPPTEARAAFDRRYRESFGAPPPRIATLAYDAVALAAILARAPGGPEYGYYALTAENGFVGLDGIFRFRPDGQIERGLSVLEVRRKSFRQLSPPPESFAKPSG